MGQIYKSVTELIGRTPLMELANFERHRGFPREFWQSLSILIQPEASRTA